MKKILKSVMLWWLGIFLSIGYGFGAVQDQAILSVTEIFANYNYGKFESRYNVSSAEATRLFSNTDVLRIFSYLKVKSSSESQFYSLIDTIDSQYDVRDWDIHASKVTEAVNKAFGESSSSSSSSSALNISSNRTAPSIDQWVNVSLTANSSYRGWVDFYVQYRANTSDNWTTVSSTNYFTANNSLTNGVRFTAEDAGAMTISNFIRFARSWYYRVYARDNDGVLKYVQFDVETSSSNSNSLRITANTTSPAISQWVSVTVNTNTSYRGDVLFGLQYRSSSSSSWGTASSSYYEADRYFSNGYGLITADGGRVSFPSFLRFSREGYFRLSVRDEDGNEEYLQFEVNSSSSNNGNNSNNGNTSSDNTSYGNMVAQYTYTASNCKKYTIWQLDSGYYTSPDFLRRMYFVSGAFTERYIDSKNFGTCTLRTSYATDQTISNNSTTVHIAPNGKVYFVERDGSYYYSLQTEGLTRYSSLAELREKISWANPLLPIWTHGKIDTQETFNANISYTKEFIIYQTEKGWMSYDLPEIKYFATAQELKDYINKSGR